MGIDVQVGFDLVSSASMSTADKSVSVPLVSWRRRTRRKWTVEVVVWE